MRSRRMRHQTFRGNDPAPATTADLSAIWTEPGGHGNPIDLRWLGHTRTKMRKFLKVPETAIECEVIRSARPQIGFSDNHFSSLRLFLMLVDFRKSLPQSQRGNGKEYSIPYRLDQSS